MNSWCQRAPAVYVVPFLLTGQCDSVTPPLGGLARITHDNSCGFRRRSGGAHGVHPVEELVGCLNNDAPAALHASDSEPLSCRLLLQERFKFR